MEQITFTVTQADFDQAVVETTPGSGGNYACACIVAQSLLRITGKKLWVGNGKVYDAACVNTDFFTSSIATLDNAGLQIVRAFDKYIADDELCEDPKLVGRQGVVSFTKPISTPVPA